ncbi:InlB B-repeat-containing protein, partial [Candidatus Saccharibacteria bacterium]|nr:InlB B-repeat-containing protein [Candidatus Saccharibacteria bacterium]
VTSNNTISTSSTAIGSTATALSSNTWGLNSEDTSTYVGLPTYANATNTALTSKSSVSEESTVSIYYGLKVDTRITPGTYTGDVLYTVLMDSSCLTYTVVFDANTADTSTITGTMNNQTITTNTATALTANAYERSGYTFLGWSTSATGATGTAVDGVGTAADVDYDNEESVTNLTTSGSTITLYAIWEAAGHILTLTNGSTAAISSVALTNTSTGATITSGSTVAEGTSVTATCTPKSGYHCTEFTSSDTTLLPSQTGNTAVGTYTYSFTMPAGAITLTAKGSGNTFTINYNSNGGSGTTTATTATYGSNVTLRTDNFTAPSGKIFKAWGTDTSGTTTYEARAVVAPATLYPSVTTTQGGSITLYAIWEDIVDDGDLGMMQSFNCANLTSGHTGTVTDSRDNQTYTVYRFRDTGTAAKSYPTTMAGYCIMTKDLSLGYVTGGSITKGSNLSLTTTASNFDTNASNSSYETISLSGTQTVTYVNSANNGTGWSTTNSYTNMQYTYGTATNSSHGYYSYGAALVVCPKGWRLPTNTEYSNIATFMGGSNSTGSAKIRRSPYNFVYGGDFSSSDWSNVGSYGYYWSSTQYSSTNGRNLTFGSSYLGTSYNYKYYGRSVRCVAEPAPYMQDVSASDLTESATTTLVDSRDNQEYTVYRWPSTGTAGTSYPTGMAGYAIMTKDLSLGYVTGGSITKGGNLTLTTSDSAAAGTITYVNSANSGSGWSTTNSDSNLQYTYGTATNSSHGYYSYGAAQKVCPKGWRLPTQTEYANIATFMGGDNSTGSSKIRGTPYNFVYGGNFFSSGWSSVGSYGGYWASTQYSSTSGYNLNFRSSSLGTSYSDKYYGRSVRCVSAP